MVRIAGILALGGMSAVLLGGATAGPSHGTRTGRVIVVKTVDVSATEFRFEPASVTVEPGDTVRFVQTTGTPHNVQFEETPTGASLGDAMMGPFLTSPGESYTLVIDARFVGGKYSFVCTPHATMGMTGALVVHAKGK